jgi:hypothetical protein
MPAPSSGRVAEASWDGLKIHGGVEYETAYKKVTLLLKIADRLFASFHPRFDPKMRQNE